MCLKRLVLNIPTQRESFEECVSLRKEINTNLHSKISEFCFTNFKQERLKDPKLQENNCK